MGKVEYEIYLGLLGKNEGKENREQNMQHLQFVDCYSKFEYIFGFICACIAL